jgi:hypothetical protein
MRQTGQSGLSPSGSEQWAVCSFPGRNRHRVGRGSGYVVAKPGGTTCVMGRVGRGSGYVVAKPGGLLA